MKWLIAMILFESFSYIFTKKCVQNSGCKYLHWIPQKLWIVWAYILLAEHNIENQGTVGKVERQFIYWIKYPKIYLHTELNDVKKIYSTNCMKDNLIVQLFDGQKGITIKKWYGK